MTEVPMKAAYCHPDEVQRAQLLIDYSVDKDAVVTPHPWMKPGELIITAPGDQVPYSVAFRHMLEEFENPALTLADVLRMGDRFRVDYRLPVTW